MEVILLESFDRLGKIGDIVNVKDGFARNYLLPQKKALRANKENKDHFTKIKKELIEKNNQIIEEAKKCLKKISEEEIIFIRNASDNGQLYGSFQKDISNYFNEKKIDVKSSNINLHSAIKKVGIYNINIKLHAEVTCDLKINVATSIENATLQKNELNKPENTETTKKEVKKEEALDTDKTKEDKTSSKKIEMEQNKEIEERPDNLENKSSKSEISSKEIKE